MSGITSYAFTDNTYIFSKGAVEIDRYYLPDSYLETPAGGDSEGVRITEDFGRHKRFLSNVEVVAIGFANVAALTVQFDSDKATAVAGSGVTSPTAPDRSVQFNNAGAFGGDADLGWDNKKLEIGALRVSEGNATSGTGNAVIGNAAAGNLIAAGGHYNTVIGSNSGAALTTGDNNIMVGNYSGNAIVTGGYNVCIGKNTGGTCTGTNNTFIGKEAGYSGSMTSAADNTGIGTGTLKGLTTGDYNIVMGYYSGSYISTGSKNVSIGFSAGAQNETGSGNIFIGNNAGYAETGSNKLEIGYGYSMNAIIQGDLATGHLTINDVLTVALQTAASASGITPAEGMIVNVSDTDGTFLTTGIWIYQGAAWNAFAFV